MVTPRWRYCSSVCFLLGTRGSIGGRSFAPFASRRKWIRRSARRELQRVQAGVLPLAREELVMGAQLDDAAVREHGDPVRVADGGEAVGDHQTGAIRHE